MRGQAKNPRTKGLSQTHSLSVLNALLRGPPSPFNERTFLTWTFHVSMEALPSNPGVNWRTTENGWMLETASRVGGSGWTGSTDDWIVAATGRPGPTEVHANTSNV